MAWKFLWQTNFHYSKRIEKKEEMDADEGGVGGSKGLTISIYIVFGIRS